jgi:hypothetical protein
MSLIKIPFYYKASLDEKVGYALFDSAASFPVYRHSFSKTCKLR